MHTLRFVIPVLQMLNIASIPMSPCDLTTVKAYLVSSYEKYWKTQTWFHIAERQRTL